MEKINANIVIEIMGRPKDNVSTALEGLVAKLGSEKGVKIMEKKIHEPAPVKESDLFTAFAELSLELDSLDNYFGILFAYMPSHVEIIKPENIKLSSYDFNELSNKLIARLHDYDAMAKRLIGEREIMMKQLEHLKNGGKLEDVFGKPVSKPAENPQITKENKKESVKGKKKMLKKKR